MKLITDEISTLASRSFVMEFHHYSRVLNTVAHYVAREATDFVFYSKLYQNGSSSQERECVFWTPNFPNWLFPFINEGG